MGRDIWSEWLLHRRFGGDARRMQMVLDFLRPIRDKVLHNARLAEGETVLDVGCGDGMIGFGALEKIASGTVILSDISQDLLEYVQSLARDIGLLDRCQFVLAPAEDLSVLDAASVDVVALRSVLIYVSAKQQAFREFYQAKINTFEGLEQHHRQSNRLSASSIGCSDQVGDYRSLSRSIGLGLLHLINLTCLPGMM